MSRSHSLTDLAGPDKGVDGELFALYQARLRAEEIDFAAREQYNADLHKRVTASFEKLDGDYNMERANIDRGAKIRFSVTKNQQRIRVLQCQQEIVNHAMDHTRKKLEALCASGDYHNILVKLIKQGLKVLDEEEAVIQCRERDYGAVENALNEAMQGRPGKAYVNRDFPLEDKVIGGVVVANATGTIRCDNTFEGRLLLATEGSLPQIGPLLKQ